MYIEARDLFVKGLDFRIGQQLVQWGVGDQFNPTNTLNANDVEDPLLFGEQQANLMALLEYTPEAVTGPSLGYSFPYIARACPTIRRIGTRRCRAPTLYG